MRAHLASPVPVSLAAVASLVIACCAGRAGAPPPAAPRSDARARVQPHAPLCTPLHDVVLPQDLSTIALTEVNDKLAVDGTVTAVTWPSRAPTAFALADGRVLIDETHDTNELWLWDPASRTLTSLGVGGLAGIPGHGSFIHTSASPGTVSYSGIDPRAPRLRELYRGPADSFADFAGVLDGAMTLLESAPSSGAGLASPATLVCLSGPGDITRIPFDLPPSLRVAGHDAIRGHRLLLVGTPDRSVEDLSARDDWARHPFQVPVEIVDLDTHARRRLGLVRGSYTAWTDMPHPYGRVVWSDVPPADPDDPAPQVDVATETLR